jgi:hypothetical protein
MPWPPDAMNGEVNILVAWFGIFTGAVAGVVPGLLFHREGWLGGYGSWRRRLMRLGHVSFFGIAFLNLAFAWTVRQAGWRPASSAPALALAAAELLMPLVCYLAAWHVPLRRLFLAPVGCVLYAVASLVLGRMM